MASQENLELAEKSWVISPASESLAHSALGLACTWQSRTPFGTRTHAQNQTVWVTSLVCLGNTM